jgi:hypothetical protein
LKIETYTGPTKKGISLSPEEFYRLAAQLKKIKKLLAA